MQFPHWLPERFLPERTGPGPRKPPINEWTGPVARYIHSEEAGGVVLLACTLLAIGLANSPWAAWYTALWETKIGLSIGAATLKMSLGHWINDGLMTIFFFLVGLEIKREFVFGELGDPRKAALPIAAAIGGMLAPAAIYLALQWGQPGQGGWAIPMATDIAFVVGFLALLGPRIPFGLKIFLLTLAIVDDIGAIVVIAVAFSHGLSVVALACAAAGFGLIWLLNRIGVRTIPAYVVAGAGIWLAVYYSGIHPTIAGVLLGLMTPAGAWFGGRSLLKVVEGVVASLQPNHDEADPRHDEAVELLLTTSRETISPLARLETSLHPWVAFVIMPLFALANAGVVIDAGAIGNPVALAVAAGLVVGKPLGILGFCLLAVGTGLGRLPGGVGWKALCGGACLAGIGFTMSIFLAGLALPPEHLTAGKLGTISGSTISAILGAMLLIYFLPAPQKAAAE